MRLVDRDSRPLYLRYARYVFGLEDISEKDFPRLVFGLRTRPARELVEVSDYLLKQQRNSVKCANYTRAARFKKIRLNFDSEILQEESREYSEEWMPGKDE